MAKLEVGQIFPDIEVDLLYGGKKNIKEVFDADKTVIWCLRYVGCTVCRYDIHLAQQRYDEVTAKGGKLVFMLQSRRDILEKEFENMPLPFDIIMDPEMKIYEELEIKPAASMEELGGGKMGELMEKGAAAKAAGFSHGEYEGNEQQLPAMFMVDKDGKIEFAHYAKDIMDMPVLDDVLKML